MYPEYRSSHLLLPPPPPFDHVAGQSQTICTRHNDPPSLHDLSIFEERRKRSAKNFQFSFNFPLPFSSFLEILLEKFTHPSPFKTHTKRIINLPCYYYYPPHPPSTSLTFIRHPSTSIPRVLRTLPQRNLLPLLGALFHSPIPRDVSEFQPVVQHTEARTKDTGARPAVRSCVIDTVTRTGKDPSGPSLTSSLGRGREESGARRVPRETRGDRDRPTRDVSPLPPRPTANGHPRLAPPSTWRTVDTAAFNRWRCAVSPSLFHHGRPLSFSLFFFFSLSLSRALTEAQPRLSCVCRADYRNCRLFSRLFCSMVNSRPADIDALLSRQSAPELILSRMVSGIGPPRGGRVLEFRRRNSRKRFGGGKCKG